MTIFPSLLFKGARNRGHEEEGQKVKSIVIHKKICDVQHLTATAAQTKH